MDADNKKIEFFKNRILDRLQELRPYMSDIKYKLYNSMINDCNNLDDIREMAELDLQFNMIKYVKELEEKLKLSDTNIEELEAVTNQNARAAKLTVIQPKKKEARTSIEVAKDIDMSDLAESMNDEELLASAANILMMRMATMPPEEKYRDEIEEYADNELNEEGIENLEVDDSELFGDEEETDENENDENDDIFDIDESELGLDDDNEEEIEDVDDDEEDDEEDNDDAIIDFGMPEGVVTDGMDDKEEGFSLDDLDSLNDSDIFGDDVDEEDEDSDSEGFSLDDIESLDDSDIFMDDDDTEDESDDPFSDIENMSDDDLFVDDEEDTDDDEEDLDSLIDSIGDDMFETDEDEDEDDDDSEEDLDSMIDSLGDDMFMDDDEPDEDDSDDEEDELDNLDNLSPNDLFVDDDDDDDDDDEESSEDDLFDIDESELGYEEPDSSDSESEFDDFFARHSESTQNTPVKREKTPEKIFVNGTKRGEQTQQMFNIITKLFDNAGKTAKKTALSSKNLVRRITT